MSVWNRLKDFLKDAKDNNVVVNGVLMVKLPYDGVDIEEVKIKNSSFVCPMCLQQTEDFGICCEKCHKILGYNKSLKNSITSPTRGEDCP